MKIEHSETVIIRTPLTKFSGDLKLAHYDYTHVKMKACNIPKTFYVLPSSANLYITEGSAEGSTEGGVKHTIQIDEGNYAWIVFGRILNKLVNESSTTYTYTISTANRSTEAQDLKYTFSVEGNGGVQPIIETDNVYLAQMLGIDPNVQYVFSGDTFKSPYVRNFQAYDELVIKSNLVDTPSKILSVVFSAGNQYDDSIIHHTNYLEDGMVRVHNNNLRSRLAEFELTDIDGNPVHLNGSKWSLILNFYKFDYTFENNVKNYIDYRFELDGLEG